MKRFGILVVSVVAVFAGSTRAFWFGSPGESLSNGRTEIQATYDTGSRSIQPKDGGPSIDMDTDRFYLELAHGLGNGLDLFGRFMPQTGDASFEHSSYNPSIWGMGGGLHWAPAQSSRLKWGGQVNLDWNQGKDQGVKLNVTEMAIAGGPSYEVNRNIDVYGGASFMNSNVTIKYAANSAKFELENNFGLFAGVGVRPTPNLTLAFELHLINETLFGFNAAYRFGGGSSGESHTSSRHHRHGR